MEQDKSYIFLYKSIHRHWIYPRNRKFTEFEAWIDLLLLAKQKEEKVLINKDLVNIKRGSLIISENKLGIKWFWSRDKVRNFFDVLVKDFMILKTTTKNYTMITICNYESYQQLETTKKQQKNNKKTTFKDDKLKENQKLIDEQKSLQKEEESLKLEFDNFRINYLGTKRGLEIEFDNLKEKNKDWKQIIPQLTVALNNQMNWRKALKEKERFVPEWKNLTTWINNKCWTEIHTRNEVK